MIGTFESMVRMYPERICFTFVDESGREECYTYRQTRLIAAGLARRLQEEGVQPGDCMALDLPNRPAFVFLLLAAAYASFVLVPINFRLTSAEKQARLTELERQRGVRLAYRIDAQCAERLFSQVKSDLEGGGFAGAGWSRSASQDRTAGRGRPAGRSRTQAESPRQFLPFKRQRQPETAAFRNEGRRGRVIMGAQQDAEEEAIHFAERQAHLFDEDERALILFTSGTMGKPKAVPLTWRQLTGAARASNRALNRPSEGLWQAALPLYHVGGLQVVVRSLLNRNPFVLYGRFDAKRVLRDARRFHATHVSVVDKMLQDLLAADEADVLREYQCILLGGGALNRMTLARALAAEAQVYASYGMTETSSQIAHARVDRAFKGGLRLLSGYRARIVDADAEGYGQLAVDGPGVFEGYLNARAAFTVDGYFLTGDTAAFEGGLLYLRERTDDMFVSGGENVYPAEIADRLRCIPGVADAYVFGVPDSTWGRRPVAFLERETYAQSEPSGEEESRTNESRLSARRLHTSDALESDGGQKPDESPNANDSGRDLVRAAYANVRPRLSKLYMPKQMFAVDELPRTGIGKVNRAAIEQLYEQRIEIKHVNLYHIRLPFKTPFKTAKATLKARDSLIVEVVDHAGRTGLGECVAFATDWYLPETLGCDATVLRRFLIPQVTSQAYLHPRDAAEALEAVPEAAAFPLARGALEPALWDLYGKIMKKPLWKLVCEEAARMDEGGSASSRAGGTFVAADGGGRSNLRRAGDPRSGSDWNESTAMEASSYAHVSTDAAVKVEAGVVVGLGTPQDTVAAVRRCVEAGYRRVKLKVAPGSLASVRAVRQAFPQLMVTLDANQSFGERDREELHALDACGAKWIEEPLNMGGTEACGRRNASDRGNAVGGSEASSPSDFSGQGESPDREGVFDRLASLQRTLSTPLCLDESFTCPEEAYQALEHPELRCFAVKIGKFGGVMGALKFMRAAQARGAQVWMGGMYDTGISKRLHAAFQTLPGIDSPGDVGSPSCYFPVDVTDPAYEVDRGKVVLNNGGNPWGLGCSLNRSALSKVLVKRIVVE